MFHAGKTLACEKIRCRFTPPQQLILFHKLNHFLPHSIQEMNLCVSANISCEEGDLLCNCPNVKHRMSSTR